ncbi:MAG: metallophosphoesterase [Gemmataceae bacterium]|nr:metallophosphoesterase [Gemmataceae bacterium]
MAHGTRLAFAADLHMNHQKGQDAVAALIAHLERDTPDVLVLAGDIAASTSFGPSLERFAGVRCVKAVIPGNHDLWVPTAHPTDSLHAYETQLPEEAVRHGFHWLDGGPLVLPERGLALAGSVNWYDGSWAIDALRERFPGELHRLKSKTFPRGRLNDAVYVRMALDDGAFTARVVEAFERHLDAALAQAGACIAVAHHPPMRGMSFPREGPPETLEHLLWDAFAGNARMEAVLAARSDRVPLAFCGHTHWEREERIGATRAINIGGGYERKRLLVVDWPAGSVAATEFG